MAVSVIYKPAAQAEIEEVYAEYETLRDGLGTVFLDELSRIEAHLRMNPALYQKIEDDLRRAVFRRFPYGLFYIVEGDQVIVLGCLHLSRDPRSHMELRVR